MCLKCVILACSPTEILFDTSSSCTEHPCWPHVSGLLCMHATLIKAYPLVTPVPAACNAVYLFQLHTGYLVELMRRIDCCHCETPALFMFALWAWPHITLILHATCYTDKAAKSEACQARGPSRTVLTLIVYSLAEGSGWVYICV